MHFIANIFGILGLLSAGSRGRHQTVCCIKGEEVAAVSRDSTELPEILMLPPSVGAIGETRQINLGETISLEELGPIIINADGTTRRITNWSTLNKNEQENSWRVISARNLKRLKVLQKQSAVVVPAADTEKEL